MSNTSTPAMSLENPGVDPGTSRMLSGRSTIWANSPIDIEIETPVFVIELGIDLKCSSSIFFSNREYWLKVEFMLLRFFLKRLLKKEADVT